MRVHHTRLRRMRRWNALSKVRRAYHMAKTRENCQRNCNDQNRHVYLTGGIDADRGMRQYSIRPAESRSADERPRRSDRRAIAGCNRRPCASVIG